MAEPDDPWWTKNQEATNPSSTDLCGTCGHSRDLHNNVGCTVEKQAVQSGGYDGDIIDRQTGRKTGEAWLPANAMYVRRGCGCTLSSDAVEPFKWYKCSLPPGFRWDGLTKVERDKNEKKDANGNYHWWI